MTDLENYASLEERRKQLTTLTLAQKAELVELRKKKKYKEAEDLEKQYEDNLFALKNVMTELPLAKAAAEKERMANRDTVDSVANAQLDNEIIHIDGEYALVLCTDNTLAYTVQPEGTAEIGDPAFEADLKDFAKLSEDVQERLIAGYRKQREARGAI